MGIELRLAVANDLAALIALDSECFPPGNFDLEPAPPGELASGIEDQGIFVASSDGLIVGMLQFDRISSNSWELLTLAVSASYRGMGIGKALIEQLFLELNKSPYLVGVNCLTSPNNLPMQALLESFGFIQVGLVQDYYGPGKHRLRFQLN